MKLNPPSKAAAALSLCMVLLLGTAIFAQQAAVADSSNDSVTAKRVCAMVSRFHISGKPINDEISQKLMKRFIKQLDPQKLYFYQSDIEHFEADKTQLDDKLAVGDVSFAYDAFNLYLQRLQERMDYAQQLVDVDHDFTVDESIVVDAKDLDFAKDQNEMNERWRKRVKYDLLNLILEDTELAKAREQLHKRYRNNLRTMSQTEKPEKLEMYLSALTHCFDPHSSYMSPQTLEDFRISMELSLDGIGAALRSEDGYTVVAEIVPGGAADADGRLKAGDKIVGVAQEDGEFVDVVEMKLSKVVRYIRGKRGTIVQLRVKKEKNNAIEVYKLTRKKIELSTSEVKGKIIETGERLPGQTGRIGVISIPSFYRDFRGAQRGDENFKSTARDVRKVLYDFRDQGGVDGIIIDLRFNGGGALSEAIEVSGLFVDEGPVVQVKQMDGERKIHSDVEPGAVYTGPLVVVCNRLSASASEIFAGVIKDYKRGLIIGDTTTHGKGTVQNVMPVSNQMFSFLKGQDLGALKLTINQFYRVNGDSTQNRGVRSDIVLPSLIDNMDLGESFLDDAMEFDKTEVAPHESLGMVSPKILDQLKQASTKRVVADKDFKETQEEIDKYLKKKNQKTISLVEATRRKEMSNDKDKEEKEKKKKEEEEKKDSAADKDIFKKDFYNDEILNITVDYMNVLKNMNTVQR
ncbi:carboxy terminal-processing peptidase [Gimesia panareensis]|uniref:Tail-specific protease n=1 Tax=Gimesia panareensis TaxID=2527978 RepID=A0A518A2I5_9PLAN|nr:carboxy terminal-processing peptidase [Gimesia panareensis]QDT26010.1 Tail-specific protease precursor [Gimesia panareensis]QDU48946.1 Tail-specific protease precursor [Gimesia panareensis]